MRAGKAPIHRARRAPFAALTLIGVLWACAASAVEPGGIGAAEEAAGHYRKAREHAAAERPDLALREIDRAVELQPDNPEYLEARARFANWSGDYSVAVESYERLLALGSRDESLMLNLARSRSWGGDLTGAVRAYDAYMSGHPDDAEALIEYGRVQAWRGDYARALDVLERFRAAVGDTGEYRKEKARVLAWAGRPTEALRILDELPPKERDEYGSNYTRTIALHYGRRSEDALDSLDLTMGQCPECREVGDLGLLVGTPLRSTILGGVSWYVDSDELSHLHTAAEGTLVYRPKTRFIAEFEADFLEADAGSGLENRDGGEDAEHLGMTVAVAHRFSPAMGGRIGLGIASAEDRWKVPIYDLGIELRPRDGLRLDLLREYGYYVLSPRTVSLRIRRGLNRAVLEWTPTLRTTVVASAGYDTFSDHNARWEAVLAPRRAVVRSERLQLDLGVNATLFGFDDDLDNGYYDPEFYQRYMVTAFGYWRLDDNDGVSFALAAGTQKDDEMDDPKFGWSADVKGTFGIFADWMFELRGAVMENVRQTAGAFRGYRVEAFVTRRLGQARR